MGLFHAARAVVTMPNKGQISNLPMNVCVETWAEINGSGVFPLMSGEISSVLQALVAPIVEEQELTVEAAYVGDISKLEHALLITPTLQNKECASELARKLVDANRAHLPRFS